ncbi:MAG: hypothetical protein JSV82_00740 [Planctomycetota bacterium]|nr:MAG: hypothetical protein JSV82_00740 [Planctomycetota bacterium]
MRRKMLPAVLTAVLLASATSSAERSLTWTLDDSEVNEIEINLHCEFTVQIASDNALEYTTAAWVGPSDGNNYEEGDPAKITDIAILPAAGGDAWVHSPAETGYPGWWSVMAEDFVEPYTIAAGNQWDVTIKAMAIGTHSLTCDFNLNGPDLLVNVVPQYIDWCDLAPLLGKWQDNACSDANDWCCRADLNRDSEVDLKDFAWLAKYWSQNLPAPNEAYNPDPNDTAANVSITADLTWTAGAYTACHAVYFGTDSVLDADDFRGYQTNTTFDPGSMAPSTPYYWRIDEVGIDVTTTGPIWSFTTAPPTG